MRKFIDGKAYNMETAPLIVVLPCPHARDDFSWSEHGRIGPPKAPIFWPEKGGELTMV